MLILWLGTLLFVRYVAKEIFFRISYHAAVALTAGNGVLRVGHAWIYSTLWRRRWHCLASRRFLAIGYLTHLISMSLLLDVMDTRIKASFGNAIKLYDYRYRSLDRHDRCDGGLFMFTRPKVFWRKSARATLGQPQHAAPSAGQVVRRYGLLVDGVPARRRTVMPASASRFPQAHHPAAEEARTPLERCTLRPI